MGIGAAMLGASGLGALGSIGSSWLGANAQMSAEQNAMAQIEKMFGIGQNALNPFIQAGNASESKLMGLLGIGPNNIGSSFGSLTKPFNPSMASLAATPGYQFALQQGEEATQNSFAGQGLGASGNAMRGGINYAEGLVSNTYQQQFQNSLAQNQQIANLLLGPTQLGGNAAEGLAGLASGTGSQLGQAAVGIGNAQAGAWGATGGALNGLGGNISQLLMMNQLFGGELFGGKNAGANAYDPMAGIDPYAMLSNDSGGFNADYMGPG